MTHKIIVIGHNIDPDEQLRVMLKTLHALGCDIEHPTIESAAQVLRDEYDIEVSIKKPLTIQEFSLSKMDELAKHIALISAEIKQAQKQEQKCFSHNQQKYYNRMQNIRIKAFKSRHR
ncbi:MAG: hypothetical protein MJ170_00300 [Alphaproteobacteria bacterium]|nr:hypothetical protein [Alphaproteobacteria bacterium]